MPVRILVTAGTVADCSQASALIEGVDAQYLLADKGYDSDALVAKAETGGMKAVIPSRRNRKQPRDYDKELYRLRHRVENVFCTSSAGEASPPVMPRIPPHSWLPCKSGASHFGQLSYHDTI